MDLSDMRQHYAEGTLRRGEFSDSPFVQFEIWFDEARRAGVNEPNAFVLGTATKDGQPSTRTLLLKKFDEDGFVFYSHYDSRKGREMEENPRASMTFLWQPLIRQVTIEGTVSHLSDAESDAYFSSRPRRSQLGAWASKQGRPLDSYEDLQSLLAKQTEAFEGQDIPRPKYWGGFILHPKRVEFWQGRPNRLHDRFEYLHKNGQWSLSRLSP